MSPSRLVWPLLWLGLCAQQAGLAADTRPLSLEEALQAALSNHPILVMAELDVESAVVRVRQARSVRSPQIDGGGLAKRGLSGSANMFGLNGLAASPDPEDMAFSGNVLQDLLDFKRSRFETEARRAEVEYFEETLRAEEAALVLIVTEAYYSILKALQQARLAERAVAEAELAVRRAASRLRAQLGSGLDVQRAEHRAARAALNRAKAVEALEQAHARLAEAMGTEAGRQFSPAEPERTPVQPSPPEPLVADALESRPELAAVDARIRAAEAWVRRAEREKYPRIMAMFSGGWTRFAERTLSQLLFAGFGIQLPIFTGGRLEAGIQQARLAMEKTRAVREELKRAVQLQVIEARSDAATAVEAVRAAGTGVEQARSAERLAGARHRNLLADALEVEAARTALAAAESERNRALYDYEIAFARLAFATGSGTSR